MRQSPMETDDRWYWRPAFLVGLGIAGIGFVISTISTHLTLAASEPPVTGFLIGGRLAAMGLTAVVAVRVASVVGCSLVITRLNARYLPHGLAVMGIYWIGVGCWQAWLMLART